MNFKSVTQSLILLLAISSFSFAQTPTTENVEVEYSKQSVPAFITFKEEAKRFAATDEKSLFSKHLQTTNKDEFKETNTSQDDLGFTHKRFQQYYEGVKVEYGTYLTHSRNNKIETANGDFKRIENIDLNPKFSENAALASALTYVGAEKFMWEDKGEEDFLKRESNNTNATYYPKGELVIVEDFNKIKEDGVTYTLAYKFDVYAQNPVSRDYIYVSAQTGRVVHVNPIIKHCYENKSTKAIAGTFYDKVEMAIEGILANVAGTAATRYSGTQSITADNGSTTSGKPYRLREVRGTGLGIETYNCKKTTNYTTATDFTDNDNNWSATEYNNAAYDNAALDAHWGAEKTYDYWKNTHNRNSYDNAGAKIKSYVHYSSAYDNAFWDGTRMTYGDGSGAGGFKPLTALDVCGHEIGHAICTYTANLTYSNESGALNEAFSDIWGAAVEYYAVPTKSTWLIGEDIEYRTGHVSLRSMSNPNAEGQPDTYQGTYWYTGTGDNGGVHYNSGVLNYGFYLLSVGGSGTNDKGSSFSVTGITIAKAAKIAYRAESVYLTASSNYSATRTAFINAAKDLYGAGSQEEISTTNAFYAIGVGAAYSGGSTTTCAVPAPSASSITSSGFTISWAAVSGATSYDVQYKTSAATTWTTVNTTTTSRALTGLTASTTYNFQVRTNCSTGSSAYSTAGSATTLSSGGTTTPTYCASNGTSQSYEWIDYVALGSIARTSTKETGGYFNSTLSTNLVRGTSNTITLSAGFTSTVYKEYWKVYIDYNKDGDFLDSGETVVNGSATSSGNVTGTFTVPTTASTGATKLRVVMSDATTATSCGTFSYGETEDYVINIATSLIAENGTEISSGVSGTIISPTNSREVGTDVKMNAILFPNPTRNGQTLNVVYDTNFNGSIRANVIDIMGRVVMTEQWQATEGSNRTTINTNNLTSGTYMLNMVDEKNNTSTYRFAIVR